MWKTKCHIFYMYLATGLIDFIVIGPLQKKTIPTYRGYRVCFSLFFPFVLQIIVTQVPITYPVGTSLPCSIPSLRCRRNFVGPPRTAFLIFPLPFLPCPFPKCVSVTVRAKTSESFSAGLIRHFFFFFLFFFLFWSFFEVFFLRGFFFPLFSPFRLEYFRSSHCPRERLRRTTSRGGLVGRSVGRTDRRTFNACRGEI